MLNTTIIKKLFVAFINFIFLGLIALLLLYLQNLFFPKNSIRRLDIPEVYFGIFFYPLLIYVFYAFIFGILLYTVRLSLLTQAIVTSIGSTICIYLFGISLGGAGDIASIQLVTFLFVVFILGFILPFLQRKIFKIMT